MQTVSEGVLIDTFQCLVDQIHELYRNTDSLRQDLNHFILQRTGILPASILGLEHSKVVIHKLFKGFDAPHMLFILEGGKLQTDANDSTYKEYKILTTNTMILMHHASGIVDFRDAVKTTNAMWSRETKKIAVYGVPPLLVPVLECWMRYGQDTDTYEREFFTLIHDKKSDLQFKMALSDLEHNHQYIPVPERMLLKALEIYWELN